ncbi:thioesterase family protein [Streptococcus sp. H31]|uniref:thioesterase family protein n=1 Tax=Streptococcus huangxiaojuni TaxID=3237239 RepID=UPI0034A2D4A7
MLFQKIYHTQAKDSAKCMESGELEVLATPALVAFMENTAFTHLQPQLKGNETSVGSAISIEHLAASPIGTDIQIIIRQMTRKGRQYHFSIAAYEGEELIGKAEHTRVAVDRDRFIAKFH